MACSDRGADAVHGRYHAEHEGWVVQIVEGWVEKVLRVFGVADTSCVQECGDGLRTAKIAREV